MAKNNQKSKANLKAEETQQIEEVSVEESESVAEETAVEEVAEKKASKKEKKQKPVKTKVSKEPKRSKFKEIFSELKKVSWPSFGKTMKNTGMVLSIVLIFGVVVLGFDTLISWLFGLLTKI